MPRHPILVPLSHDHREALGLAFFLHNPAPPGRVTAMTPASTPERRRARLLAFYDTYLVSHFRAEEEALFPALRTRRALVASLCDDHRRFAELRDAVAAARGDDAIHAALMAFSDLLEAHVRREERELFAFFPEGIGEAEIRRIDDAIRAVLARRDPARCNIQDYDGRLLAVESASAPFRLPAKAARARIDLLRAARPGGASGRMADASIEPMSGRISTKLHHLCASSQSIARTAASCASTERAMIGCQIGLIVARQRPSLVRLPA